MLKRAATSTTDLFGVQRGDRKTDRQTEQGTVTSLECTEETETGKDRQTDTRLNKAEVSDPSVEASGYHSTSTTDLFGVQGGEAAVGQRAVRAAGGRVGPGVRVAATHTCLDCRTHRAQAARYVTSTWWSLGHRTVLRPPHVSPTQ